MKKYIFAIIVVLVAFFAFGFYKLAKRKAELAHLKPPELIPFTVKAVKVKNGTLTEFVKYRALYEPLLKGALSPKVSGLVLTLRVKEGDSFKRGEVLATVDPTDLKSKLEATKAKLEALKAQATAAKTFYETQKLIYERNLKLYESGGLSKEQLQLSEASLKKAEAQYKEALAQIEATRAEIENLEHNIELYSKIKAPYDGKVVHLLVREGSFAPAGRPIVEIEGTSKYRLLVQVPKGERVGRTLEVNLKGKTYTFEVSKVLPAAQNDLKVVEAFVPPLPVPSGSTLTVSLETKTCKGFVIPFGALLYLDNGIFVVDAEKNLLPVEVGAVYNGLACVKSPALKEGQPILVAGQYRLREIALHKYPIKVEISQ